jgi:hypothetical protein
LSSRSAKAESGGLPGADGFIPPSPPSHSRPINPGSGLFDQSRTQNQNPGGGSGGGNDDDSNTQPECLEPPKTASVYDDYSHIYEPSPLSDTESESTSDESDLDRNFGKDSFVIASDGRKVNLDKDQLRDKAYHMDVFPNIKIPKTFDLEYVKSLNKDYRKRLEYVRDRNKLPDKTVLDMQREAANFFRASQTKAFPGRLGRKRIEGTVYINEQQMTVAFVNRSDSKCRTFIKMSDKQLERLRDRDYLLFPNT